MREVGKTSQTDLEIGALPAFLPGAFIINVRIDMDRADKSTQARSDDKLTSKPKLM